MLRIVIPNQLILNSQIPRLLFICYKTKTTTSVSRSIYPQFANTEVISYLYPGINNVVGVLHWLKHSGGLKYRSLYLFLNPGTSGLRKNEQFEGLKCCHLV
ncbi:unnamed protein product [Malus baccata var. baccata]